MKKLGILSLLGICLLFTGCFNNRQGLPEDPIIFNETEIDGNRAIENDGKYYLVYSTIKPEGLIGDFNYAFGDCLGYVGEDKNNRIYELNGESADEWLVKYYVNGEMEIPMILREFSISNESYIPESVEEPEENVLVIPEEDMNTDNVINLQVGDKTFDVVLEDNSATKALLEKLKEGNVIVNAHEYGGFEKVGDLGFSLPREDKQITTQLGDLVLYNGNQVSLFYDSNSWSYTKLGEVQNITESDLGDGDITLTFSLLK